MKKIIYLLLFFTFFLFLQVLKGEIYLEESIVIIIYLSINFFAKNFKLRFDNIFLPQNLAFLVFFIRLYFLPCLGLFFDYRIFSETRNTESELIFKSYTITLLMYFSFIIGWETFYLKSRTKAIVKQIYLLNYKKIKIISGLYFFFGLTALLLYYQNYNDYFTRIFIVILDDRLTEKTSFLEYLSSLAIYFLPFAVFGFVNLIDVNNKSKLSKNIILIISIFFVLLFSLNSNRQSMVYPLLALLAGFSTFIKFKPLPSIFIAFMMLYFLFVFGNIRVKDEFDVNNSSKNTQEIVNDIQVYAGGSQMIAPIFKMKQKKFTIFNSFISSFPIIGVPFREGSGVKLYNYLFYGWYNGNQDQIFLTQAECYVNGGYLLIFIFFIIVGYYYSYLNQLYIVNLNSQFFYRVSLFYIVLLFNSTILLSFQVIGQFLFYNSLPALIILFYYKKNKS